MNMVSLKTPSGPLKMIIVVVVDGDGDEYNGDDDDNDEYNGGQLKDPSGVLKSSRHQTQSYSSPQMIELIDCTIGEKKRRKSSQLFSSKQQNFYNPQSLPISDSTNNHQYVFNLSRLASFEGSPAQMLN